MNEKYIQALRDTIQKSHRCPSRYSQTIPVKAEANGRILWQGSVELFDLGGHPSARQCFAWSYKDDSGHLQFVTLLKIPPIDSALQAVQQFLTTRPSNA